MARYRKVEPRLWTDKRVQKLTPVGKLVWLQILTGTESNMIGLYPYRKQVGQADTGLPLEDFEAAFNAILTCGLAKYDEDSQIIYIPSFIRINPPTNQNVAKSMAACLADVGECEFTNEFHKGIQQLADADGERMWDCLTVKPKRSQSRVKVESKESQATPEQEHLTGTQSVTGSKTAPNGAVRFRKKLPRLKDNRYLLSEWSYGHFQRLWEVYPRRDDPAKAAEAWEKLPLTDELANAIVTGAEKYALEMGATEKRFIKLAATWLNATAWESGAKVTPKVIHNTGWQNQ